MLSSTASTKFFFSSLPYTAVLSANARIIELPFNDFHYAYRVNVISSHFHHTHETTLSFIYSHGRIYFF